MNVKIYKDNKNVDTNTTLNLTPIHSGIFCLTSRLLDAVKVKGDTYTIVNNVNKTYTVNTDGSANADLHYLGDIDVANQTPHQFWFDPNTKQIIDLVIDDIPEVLTERMAYNKGVITYPATGEGAYANSMTFSNIGQMPDISGTFGNDVKVVFLDLPGIKSRGSSMYREPSRTDVYIQAEITPFLEVKVSDLNIESKDIPVYTILTDGMGRYNIVPIGLGCEGESKIYIPIL